MPKTIEQGFEKFLEWLKPLKTEHSKVTKHQSSVFSCLSNSFNCYEFFETGSFGNNTGVRHFSDTDYFAVIPSKELSKNSSLYLRKVKRGLTYTFHSTLRIEVKCPAIAIPFGKYSSETMEITPCYFKGLVETPIRKFPAYGISDCSGNWMLSSPKAHNAYVTQHNKRLKYKLKPLIQLVKAWKYYNNVPIHSFYLELRVTKYAEAKQTINYDKDLLSVLNYLIRANLGSIRDPMGISGQISPANTNLKKMAALSRLRTAKSRASKAVIAKQKGKIDRSFYWWNLLFNNKFPSR